MHHAIIRIYINILLILFFFTGGLSMFILAPLYKQAFAPYARYKDFKILKSWKHIYKVMFRSIFKKGYRDLYPVRLADPPMMSNDLYTVKINPHWIGDASNCDGCEFSCCKQIDCPFIDEKGRCLCYGSWYFGYYFCGRYPSNEGQIKLYNCPKWELKNEKT